ALAAPSEEQYTRLVVEAGFVLCMVADKAIITGPRATKKGVVVHENNSHYHIEQHDWVCPADTSLVFLALETPFPAVYSSPEYI
ncbi:MAG: hypothetical protein OEY09_04730, partial [Gammaproteobacteria bacterium]|nr:hypothetical protein [Gammaproteobacteria bacterium]